MIYLISCFVINSKNLQVEYLTLFIR